jgi:ATP adenylyltransferase
MNLYPYNNGHIMIIPDRHVADFTDLTPAERHAIVDMTDKAIRALRKALNPEGFNVGYNLGSAAGAGIAGHLHQHIVPRWGGDTNFMPAVAETKVISEHISVTYEKLLMAFGELT